MRSARSPRAIPEDSPAPPAPLLLLRRAIRERYARRCSVLGVPLIARWSAGVVAEGNVRGDGVTVSLRVSLGFDERRRRVPSSGQTLYRPHR